MQESVTQDRWKYLGGSDIPAVMGISPFVKRWELLQYKAELAEPEFAGNKYTEYGNTMEPKIRDYINAGTTGEYVEDRTIIDMPVLPWRYHADGWNSSIETVLEIKTTSELHATLEEYDVYLVQLLFGMYMHNAPHGMLAVYERVENEDGTFDETFDEDRLQIFDVQMADYTGTLQSILQAVSDFTKDLDFLRSHQDITEELLPSRTVLAYITGRYLNIAGAEFKALYLLEHESDIKDAIKTVKSQLKDAMEKRNIKSVKFDDGMSITYTPAGKDRTDIEFDLEAFKQDHEDIYEKYLIPKAVKGKASYVTVRRPKH